MQVTVSNEKREILSRLSRFNVLIVCTANICRSPLAEYLLEEAFRTAPGFEAVTVGSAGIHPIRNGHICSSVFATRSGEQWREFTDNHTSLRATTNKVVQARLILTASRSSRAAVAKLDPDARSRTFTLREAEWLGSDFVHASELSGVDVIDEYAAYLNGQRGIKPRPRPKTGLFGRPVKGDDLLSIIDGHNLGREKHRKTIEQVEQVVDEVARQITHQ
jgi:protein-tyrosine phosphatase